MLASREIRSVTRPDPASRPPLMLGAAGDRQGGAPRLQAYGQESQKPC